MRFSSSVTSVSWIPSEAVTGVALKMPFEVGLAHYDPPPPDSIDDLAAFLAADRCRFANRLSAWIEVQDGVIVEHGLGGQGYIGSTTLRLAGRDLTFAAVPLPDRTRTQPLGEDSVRFEQTGGGRTALPAPRRVSHPPFVQLAAPIALSRLDPGELLIEQGAVAGDELYLLLDGVMRVEVDGKAVTDIAPGALLGERAALEGSRRAATLRAVTKCTVAAAGRDAVESDSLSQLADAHRREEQR